MILSIAFETKPQYLQRIYLARGCSVPIVAPLALRHRRRTPARSVAEAGKAGIAVLGGLSGGLAHGRILRTGTVLGAVMDGHDMKVELVEDAGTSAPAPIMLDPFAYVPDLTSALRGLHGKADITDPFYIFHTQYADLPDGPIEVELRFTGLQSRNDRMSIAIHAHDLVNGRLEVITSRDVSLRAVAASGGTVTLTFRATPGTTFAIVGRSIVPTAATATGLAILCRSVPAAALPAPAPAKVKASSLRSVASLAAAGTPTLARPISQAFTRAQCLEPTFREWQQVIGDREGDAHDQWRVAFLLQALRVYGVLGSQAHGLGLGTDYDRIAGLLRAAGCTSVAAETVAAPVRIVAAPDTPDGAEPTAAAAAPPPSSFPLPPPAQLGTYDFIWSMGLSERLPSASDIIFLIEDSTEYLKPGGFAVHLVTTTLGAPEDHAAATAGAFDRNALMQLALAAVANSNEITQLSLFTDPGDQDAKPFGVIIRKN